ncbi:hypothetical protein BG58_29995 [Caballeronia jiangsuensis]|nr:hypothetical protein BG58_29995 [Caballeronia jiangsuensis]
MRHGRRCRRRCARGNRRCARSRAYCDGTSKSIHWTFESIKSASDDVARGPATPVGSVIGSANVRRRAPNEQHDADRDHRPNAGYHHPSAHARALPEVAVR